MFSSMFGGGGGGGAKAGGPDQLGAIVARESLLISTKVHAIRGKYGRLWCLTAREVHHVDPQDFKVTDGMTMRQSKARISAGGIFVPLTNAVATLSLSFTAHPRRNIHIRTEATAPAEFEGITYR